MNAVKIIDRPGIYDISAAEYHADPAPAPSLSSSIARELLARSPLHAWFAHPKLNPAYRPDEAGRFDVGTAAHGYLLEGEAGFVVVQAADWRSKAAQAARAEARLAGKVPLLADQWDTVRAMAKAAGPQLDAHEDPPRPLAGGWPEQTLIWQEAGGIWCRARFDWLHEDRRTIDDYKTTAASANPEAWTRTLFGAGLDIQAAFYLRGLTVLCGTEAVFRFVVQENFPPYALSVVALGPDVLTIAEKKRRHAVEIWRYCLETGTWPGYPTRTCWAELPSWEETRWLARELGEEGLRRVSVEGSSDDGGPIGELL